MGSVGFSYLCVEFVQDVLKVVPLDRFFRIEELQEFLDELGRHVDLERLHIDSLVDNELQEEFVDALDVGPGRVDLLLLLDTCLAEAEAAFLNVGQGTENVLLYHLHDLVEVWDNQCGNVLLVAQKLLQLVDRIQALRLLK